MQTYVYNNALITPELSNHRVKSIFFEKVNNSFPMEVRREKLVTCLFVSLLNPSYKNFILLARTAPGLFEKESAKVSACTNDFLPSIPSSNRRDDAALPLLG